MFLPLPPKCWGFKCGQLTRLSISEPFLKPYYNNCCSKEKNLNLLAWPFTALNHLTALKNSHIFCSFSFPPCTCGKRLPAMQNFLQDHAFCGVLFCRCALWVPTFSSSLHGKQLAIPQIWACYIWWSLLRLRSIWSHLRVILVLWTHSVVCFLVHIDLPTYPGSGAMLYIPDLFSCKFFVVRHCACFISLSST